MSDINIEVADGSSVKLKTAGTYCDRDIVVTASVSGTLLAKIVNKSITEITANDLQGITALGDYIFCRCRNLSSVSLNQRVTYISTCTFSECTGLTSVRIPSSVTYMGSSVFEQCTALIRVYIDDLAAWCNITFVDGNSNPLTPKGGDLYLNDEHITNLIIPSDVVTVKSNVFYHCLGLRSVTFSEGVENIAANAFRSCTNIATVTFNGTLSAIESTAFANCTGITDIYVPWAEGAVANAPWGATNATIHYNSEV